MSVIFTDMEFPKDCGECEWFCFEGITCTTPQYYLDARCRRIPSGQDWYGEDRRGGWIGKSIAHLPGYGGRYPHEHCIEFGTRPENCPLIELPKHGDLVDRDKILQCARPAENFPPNTQVVVYGIIRDAPSVIPASGMDTNVLTKQKGEKHDSFD